LQAALGGESAVAGGVREGVRDSFYSGQTFTFGRVNRLVQAKDVRLALRRVPHPDPVW
jgi:hypothetical protein